MKKRKPLPPDELKAYCRQYGHSWIKPYPASLLRRCSYCGTYEDEKEAIHDSAFHRGYLLSQS